MAAAVDAASASVRPPPSVCCNGAGLSGADLRIVGPPDEVAIAGCVLGASKQEEHLPTRESVGARTRLRNGKTRLRQES
jgi:hypothetical protein